MSPLYNNIIVTSCDMCHFFLHHCSTTIIFLQHNSSFHHFVSLCLPNLHIILSPYYFPFYSLFFLLFIPSRYHIFFFSSLFIFITFIFSFQCVTNITITHRLHHHLHQHSHLHYHLHHRLHQHNCLYYHLHQHSCLHHHLH